MLEVKQEVAPWVDLQIVAFPQKEGILSYPNGEALLRKPCVWALTLLAAFRTLSSRGDMALNRCTKSSPGTDTISDRVHCDEIDDERSRFVETVAALAHRRGMGARVTASHTTAMHSYNGVCVTPVPPVENVGD